MASITVRSVGENGERSFAVEADCPRSVTVESVTVFEDGSGFSVTATACGLAWSFMLLGSETRADLRTSRQFVSRRDREMSRDMVARFFGKIAAQLLTAEWHTAARAMYGN